MRKELKLSILVVLGILGPVLTIGMLLPFQAQYGSNGDFLYNLTVILPFMFGFIFPIIILKERDEDFYLFIISIIIIAYTALQLIILMFNDYSFDSLNTVFIGYLGIAVLISLIVISILSHKDFGISKNFMITIIVFGFILLTQNRAIMFYLYEKTYDMTMIHTFIWMLVSQQFLFKEAVIIIIQLVFIDQLLRK